MNSLGINLQGKLVVLKATKMLPRYADLCYRLFYVTGGFGASPITRGTALFGVHVSDGEVARWDGNDVERLATSEEEARSPSVPR